MSFQEELEGMCKEVDGCQAALLMSLDGISVANHMSEDAGADAETFLIELAGPMKQAMQAVTSSQNTDLKEIVLSTEKGALIVRLLKDEYFAAMLMSAKGLIGKARYVLRAHSLSLIKELS
jgi:predicted regulator of Ras-like GTPase activity (Roadblock/LC7/MglB family)